MKPQEPMATKISLKYLYRGLREEGLWRALDTQLAVDIKWGFITPDVGEMVFATFYGFALGNDWEPGEL